MLSLDLMVVDRLTDAQLGRIANLSLEGAMVASRKPVDTPAVFACKMDLPSRLHGFEKIEFDIQAKWCKRNDSTGVYETGYQFVNLTPECKRLIRVILERYSVTSRTSAAKYPNR